MSASVSNHGPPLCVRLILLQLCLSTVPATCQDKGDRVFGLPCLARLPLQYCSPLATVVSLYFEF